MGGEAGRLAQLVQIAKHLGWWCDANERWLGHGGPPRFSSESDDALSDLSQVVSASEEPEGLAVGQPVRILSKQASQSVSQPVRPSVHRSVGQSVPAGRASQSVSQSVSQPASQPASRSTNVCCITKLGWTA